MVLLLLAGQVLVANAQGRYARVYSRSQVDNFVRQLETSSNQFRDAFREEVNNSGMNSSTKRTYNNYAAQFENSLDRLRSRFNSSNSWWESRNEVQNTINNSQNLNTVMNSAAFRRKIERQWSNLRNDLNKLADTYDLPGLNGGGWSGGTGGYSNGGYNNGGYNNGGGWNDGGGYNNGRGNVPSWAQGTFYARNPQTGGVITMSIEQSGQVQLIFDDGQPTFASMNGTRLINGQYVNNVTRISNGIRTTNIANGDFIDYYRTRPNGGWNPGGVIPGGIGSGMGNGAGRGDVPSWAQGTFYARNPQTGGIITMSIQRSGNVSINFGDGNSTTYASMNGTQLINGPYVNNVTRINNGIRTTNVSNGDFIDYYRNRP